MKNIIQIAAIIITISSQVFAQDNFNVQRINTENGLIGFAIDCEAISSCYSIAGKLCDNGYEMLSLSGNELKTTLVIECKEKEKLAETGVPVDTETKSVEVSDGPVISYPPPTSAQSDYMAYEGPHNEEQGKPKRPGLGLRIAGSILLADGLASFALFGPFCAAGYDNEEDQSSCVISTVTMATIETVVGAILLGSGINKKKKAQAKSN